MGAAEVVRREERRCGYAEWVLVWGLVLIFVWTLFQAGIINIEWYGKSDRDIDEPNNQPSVTASPGYISISPEILDDTNTVQVSSHSSVSVDAIVKAKDGRDLFTYFGLMPGETFYFEYEEPCTITAVAS